MSVEVLDYDIDLVCHLAVPESVEVLVAEKLDPELIVDEDCRAVYEWQMQHVRDQGQPASLAVLVDEFNGLEDVIDEPEAAIEDLLDRMRARYVRAQGGKKLKKWAGDVKRDPLATVQEMATEARRLLEVTASRGDVYQTGDHERAMRVYDEEVTRGPGPTFGFKELDEAFGGHRKLSFLVAPPKTGKSWLAINNVYEMLRQGQRPYLYALELDAVETDWRLKCLASNTPFWKFMKQRLDRDDKEHLAAAAEILDESGFYTIAAPPPGKRDAHYLVETAMNDGADLIIIDQLQYVETESGRTVGGKNDTGDYWDICNVLKDAAKKIPILVVHQFNRETRFADEMPDVKLIKGSAAIEETGTLVLGMWANKEMHQSGVVEVASLASRNFANVSWEIKMEMNRGCEFGMIGESED